MMDLLQAATGESSGNKPYLGFEKLSHGNHEIVKFRLVRSTFCKLDPENKPIPRKCLLVELEDQVLFLPEYISKEFENREDKVAELNEDGIKKFLFFGGRRPNR